MTSIYAFDLGTTMGLARSIAGEISSSSIDLAVASRTRGLYDRAASIDLAYTGVLTDCRFKPGDIVAYEDVKGHRGTYAAHWYGYYSKKLIANAHALGATLVPIGVSKIKKYIAGSGTAKKQAVIDAVTARGYSPVDDNEADALAILLWTINELETQ